MAPAGFFVSIEGGEGVGKSTQVRLLAEALEARGHAVTRTREPGGVALGEAIRGLLFDPATGDLVPEAELALIVAARAQHVAEVIRPALARGRVVICDRYQDSTMAYQGGGRGLDRGLVQAFHDGASGGLTPDLTVLLALDPERGLARARQASAAPGGEADGRFEAEELSFHRRVVAEFDRIAREEPGRVRRVDAGGTVEEVARAVLETVRAAWPGPGAPAGGG